MSKYYRRLPSPSKPPGYKPLPSPGKPPNYKPLPSPSIPKPEWKLPKTRVGLKKGGFPISTRKVKPGFDQEFTLPRGTSAAPIKQAQRKQATAERIKKFEHAGPREQTVITKRILGKKTKKGDRTKAAVEDAMAAKQSPWSNIPGSKKPYKKGGKV